MRIEIALSEEQEKGILHSIERGLFEYVVSKRAGALEELTSFSIEEIAAAKGVSVGTAKGILSRAGVSKEVLGYKIKRFPVRELRRVFDEATVRALRAQKSERRAA